MTERQLSDNELAVLISESFNTLPEPNPQRLSGVLHRLEKRSNHHRPMIWWIMFFVTAAAAAGGYVYHEWDNIFSTEPAVTITRPLSIEETNRKNLDDATSDPIGTMRQPDQKPVNREQYPQDDRQSPRVIYSR